MQERGMYLANIGPRERSVRRWMGITLLALGTALTWVLVSRGEDVAWWWGIPFFAIYYMAVRLVLDGQTGTCPIKAELGQRNLYGWFTILGEPIDDLRLVATLRHISRRAALFSIVSASILTFVSMWTAGAGG